MADKKEKDLTKVSDAAYIRALDSNGNPVLISKADLAQVAAELMPEVDGARPGFAPVGSVARWSYDDGCYKICEVSQYNALTVAVFVYFAGQRSVFTHYAVQLTGGAADIEPTADVFTLREGSVGGSDLAFYINKTDGNKAELYCQCKKYQYVAARLETGFSGNVMVKVDALPATAVEV